MGIKREYGSVPHFSTGKIAEMKLVEYELYQIANVLRSSFSGERKREGYVVLTMNEMRYLLACDPYVVRMATTAVENNTMLSVFRKDPSEPWSIDNFGLVLTYDKEDERCTRLLR
jgi:hypothetical protein